MRARVLTSLTLVGIFGCGAALGGCSEDAGDRSNTGGTGTGTGGAVATGGADGVGGTETGGAASGGAASGGAGTGGATTVDCSALPLCTDFDTDTLGAVPKGFTANLNYGTSGNPANVVVSDEDAHSGSQSVKVIGVENLYGIEYANPGDTFYFRTWLKIEGLTEGGNPVIVGVGGDNNDEVRMRLLKKAPNTSHAVAANAASGDGVSPVNASGGVVCTDCAVLPTEWFCFEMYVDRTSETLQFWVDGAEAVNVVNNMPWSSGAVWPAAMSKLRIGSMALEGPGPTLFIDDVAIGPSRIGCN